jgi:cobaltochelatase CobN
VEYLYGWQATAPETISPTVWQKMYDVYVADEYKLGMNRFFDRSNPAARQQIVARLLEVDRQGTYRFSAADRKQLVTEYVRLVSLNGVACSANVCGDRKLPAVVAAEARALAKDQISSQQIEQFERQFREAAPQKQISRTVLEPKHGLSRRNAFGEMTIRVMTMDEFLARSRHYVEEHIWMLLGIWISSVGLGAVVALAKRRRAGPRIERLLSHSQEIT